MLVAPLVRQQAGAFVGYIGTSPEKEEAARAGFLAEFARLCDAPVTAAELERAKRFAVGANAIRRESAGAIMADLADAWLFGDSLAEIARYESAVMAVTAAEVQAVAGASFDPARRVEVVIRGTGRAV